MIKKKDNYIFRKIEQKEAIDYLKTLFNFGDFYTKIDEKRKFSILIKGEELHYITFTSFSLKGVYDISILDIKRLEEEHKRGVNIILHSLNNMSFELNGDRVLMIEKKFVF